MKLIIKMLFCFALFAGMCGCNKKDSPEPEEYFSCKIDGRAWSYAECDVCLTEVDALYAGFRKFDRPHFEIYAQNNDDVRTTFTFDLDTAAYKANDTVQLASYSTSFCTVHTPYGLESQYEYKTINGSTGKIIFTEKTSATSRGTFQFDATNGSKVVHITEGKFKIKL